ncbi:MAG: hypothetical protein EP330_06320 [Deltaproteobacteria bacterium]|nr:MAG: hypothetical protein EP330_06320 [Deltaproteobacteria bacterium]
MTTSRSDLGPWAWARAAFIAFHLTAITLMALPAPGGGMSRTAWKTPTVQAEFRAWTGRVNAMGMDYTPAEFEDTLWDLASGLMKARSKVLAPFGTYYRYTGTAQSWRMFVAPHRFPARLEFRIEENGKWRTIYATRSPDFRWHAEHFDHDRMRSAVFRYAWPHYAAHYNRFSEYYGRMALREFPEATAFESRFFAYRTLSPEEAASGMDPDGNYGSSRVIRR